MEMIREREERHRIKEQEREERRLNRMNSEDSDDYSYSFSEDSYDSEDELDEEDTEARAFEHVFLKPIMAKTDVKAQTNVRMLQMEKKFLDEMRLEFKQELGLLLAEA